MDDSTISRRDAEFAIDIMKNFGEIAGVSVAYWLGQTFQTGSKYDPEERYRTPVPERLIRRYCDQGLTSIRFRIDRPTKQVIEDYKLDVKPTSIRKVLSSRRSTFGMTQTDYDIEKFLWPDKLDQNPTKTISSDVIFRDLFEAKGFCLYYNFIPDKDKAHLEALLVKHDIKHFIVD